jgi:phage regulator Rha-like protein
MKAHLQISTLVHVHNGKPFTDSLAMAERLAKEENINSLVKHKQFIKLIRRYEKEFSELGILNFQSSEKRGTQGAKTEFAELNEDQATFLITLLKNTDIVLRFK